jgi:hypothetical protein
LSCVVFNGDNDDEGVGVVDAGELDASDVLKLRLKKDRPGLDVVVVVDLDNGGEISGGRVC